MSPNSSLSLRPGEEELTRFEDVEDTKGNKGILGLLALTNMRVLWSVPGRRVNLSNHAFQLHRIATESNSHSNTRHRMGLH